MKNKSKAIILNHSGTPIAPFIPLPISRKNIENY